MVFQDPMTALNPVLSVERQITEVAVRASAAGIDRRARAVALLRQVGIPDPERRLGAYPHQLSGGQRQRVMLAIALARAAPAAAGRRAHHRARRDHPGADPAPDREPPAELGMALILVTHDLGVVYQAVDRVAVMYAGEVVELATTAELFARPSHPYTIGLIAVDAQRRAPAPAASHSRLAAGPRRSRSRVPVRPALRAGRPPSASRADIPLVPVGADHWSRCLRMTGCAG